ncbi:MAG: penicillin-binding protein 1C [Oceanicaulis sp.]
MSHPARLRTRLAAFLAAVAACAAAVVLLDRIFPPPVERARVVSFVAEDSSGLAMRAFPVENGRWRLAADLDRLDPDFVEALLTIEDQRFYAHPGVDPLAAARAAGQMLANGRIVSGASTITMQTARLLEPRPRTLPSKIIESLRALQLEARLTKREILELYLTLAPYGGNLQGVRAASWAWFGREPDALTPDQIALLIALPQSPEARRPDLRPETALSARAAILERLAGEGWISAARAEDAAGEALAQTRNAFPAEAWHASETLARLRPGEGAVRSTLDLALQREVAQRLRRIADAGGPGVQASALVIEIETRAVRAAVGSAGRDLAGGWLDLTAARRSPGSTLKPLVYALAFDDGTAAADTLIEDLPARFASYRPENFDRAFRGEVTIADALQHSLNVPAVRVLDRVGANRFASALSFAGADPSIPQSLDGAAGLAVALGGLGMSAQDLAVLYAALGDEGRAKPLAWTPEAAEANRARPGARLVSSESAREIVDVLYGSPAPPGRMPAHLAARAPSVAYKTGTSYGFRDAWAAGITGGHVIIVWTGRPDGAPRPGATGREAALPALFDLADTLVRHIPEAASRPHIAERRTPDTLARFARPNQPPDILFPPEGGELWAEAPGRAFVLSARAGSPVSWYVDGAPAETNAAGQPVFAPMGEGFYALSAVDAEGRETRVRVRVRLAGDGA